MAKVLRTWSEGGGTIALRKREGQRGDELELVLGNVVLLSSAALETEVAFGHLARESVDAAVRDGARPRVLVGGLGFGATLRGVLEVLPTHGEVIVVEKLHAVADVGRAEAAHLIAGALDDPRVTLVMDDVADAIARERDLSAVLLDVDNGPEWASFRTNARLYAEADLRGARAALREGGTFAVWSGYARDAFVGKLRAAGFAPRIVPLEERGVVRARAYVGVVNA